MEEGCLVLRDRERNETRYPLFHEKVGEVFLTSGNVVSTGVLTSLGFLNIDVVVATKNGRPVAMLKNLDDNAHVKTRVCQYEALKNGKGLDVAKAIVVKYHMIIKSSDNVTFTSIYYAICTEEKRKIVDSLLECPNSNTHLKSRRVS
jgi:CRISPR/Cas system-associated endonuclease Cas1